MALSKEELELNASLQKKKSALRQELQKKGILQKKGQNDYDHYSYFSESQYKELFTGLFATHKLELKFTELDYVSSTGTGKMANVRTVRLQFSLIDVETGYSEETVITGEAFDKSDKAGYKAYTGALKYYLADTFLVATGDDPEKDTEVDNTVPMITQEYVTMLNKYGKEKLGPLMRQLNKKSLSALTLKEAQEMIRKLEEK